MEIAIAAALIAWLITSAVDRAKAEYGHERDRHLKDVQKAHPDWSPRRQRRVASHRARGYWANEIAGGFPTMRSAFRENRELARVERAEADAAGAKRWAELRERLEAAKAEREKYVAEQVRKDPATDKTKARKSWIDRRKLGEALRTGVAAAKIELNEDNGQPAPATPVAPAHGTDGPDGEKPAAQKPDATAGRPKATPGTPPRTDTGTQRHELRRCATCNAPVAGREFLCAGCTDLAELTAHIRDLKRRRDAATDQAERDRYVAELLEARQRRNGLHRAMEARKANGGRAPEPVNGQPDPGSAAASAQRRCERGGQPASRLYPLAGPDGVMQAVCGTCVDGGNCGAPNGPRTDAEATPGSPGDQADPVYADAEPAPTGSPTSKGGADHDTNTTGGNPMAEAGSVEAARQNAMQRVEKLTQFLAEMENEEAEMIAWGLNNDTDAMQKWAAFKEALGAAAAPGNAFKEALGKHAGGEEYAATGYAVNDIRALQHQ